jgi:anaerobic selenocysteine-containing dehydrogenase
VAEKRYVNLGVGGGPVFVYVNNGVITRVRPMVFDENERVPTWTIEALGKKFSAPRRVTLAPFSLTERARVYSEDRIKYPLKRVGFDPIGSRNPEMRGKSSYERISWDKALEIIANEMRRIRSDYGPAAVGFMGSSHHNSGNIGIHRSTLNRFFRLLGSTDYWELG